MDIQTDQCTANKIARCTGRHEDRLAAEKLNPISAITGPFGIDLNTVSAENPWHRWTSNWRYQADEFARRLKDACAATEKRLLFDMISTRLIYKILHPRLDFEKTF
jgi:hypothetical protein